jgi:hypothetical protein
MWRAALANGIDEEGGFDGGFARSRCCSSRDHGVVTREGRYPHLARHDRPGELASIVDSAQLASLSRRAMARVAREQHR